MVTTFFIKYFFLSEISINFTRETFSLFEEHSCNGEIDLQLKKLRQDFYLIKKVCFEAVFSNVDGIG